MSYSLISAFIAGHHTAMAVRSAAVQQPSLLVIIPSQDGEIMQVSLLAADIPIHQAFADKGLDVVRVSLGGEQLDIKKTLSDNGVEEGDTLRIQSIEGIRDRLIELATQSMQPGRTGHQCHPNDMRLMPSVDLLDQAVRFGDSGLVTDLIDAGAPADGIDIKEAALGDVGCMLALFNGSASSLSREELKELARTCPQPKP